MTFLFTDIEGSTRLWELHRDAMDAAMQRHNELVRGAIEANGGAAFKIVGDEFCAAFSAPSAAMAAAIDAQRALGAEKWSGVPALRVRMAVHTGVVDERDGDYSGPDLARCSRLLSIGHGGQVLVSLVSRELVRDDLPEGVGLIDLGEHRLRDLARAERVFQLAAPGLQGRFPDLAGLDAFPNNLPVQLTNFVGREHQIRELVDSVRRCRLLTLTGVGGAGKTRLALQVGAEMVRDYPDGVWFVDLSPITEEQSVLQRMAAVLGVKEEPSRPLEETVIAFLHDRSLLIVLDNCEHMLAATAILSDRLLHAAPGLRILATSREALGVPGETVWQVPALSVPLAASGAPADESAESVSQFEAVRLFIDRAVSVERSFQVNNANAPAVAEICHRLDGIPLAIELAAAQVTYLPVELLAERLGDRFGLLARSSPTIQPRQQTLRGAIDWSHELLGDDERALFRRLAVFRGGWTLEQCEELCVDDDGCAPAVVQLLGRLVQKSLVIAEHSIGSARYRMLSTIRQYASEKLEESGEAQQLQDAHLALFTALAERLARDMVGERQAESLDRLELEQGNMRAALEWACGAGDTRLGLQLGAAIWKFWGIRGYWDAGQDVLGRLLALPDAQGCLAERARALTGRGNLVWAQGDFEAAKRDFEESLAISRELGDDAETAGCLRNLGLVAYRHGDYDSAQRLFEESLAIRRELGDQRGISHCLNNLGGIAVFRGDLESAKEYHEQSLEIRRRLNDERAVAIALNNLGEVVLRQGDRESARSMVEESLAIRRRLDDLWGMGSALHLLGVIDLGCDDESGSLSHEQESLTIRNRLGDKSGIAENLGALALLRSRSGETLRAARLSGAASALRDSIGGSATDVERHWQSETEATCRAALGDDGWRSATATGRALPLAQAVAEALE